jgi:hypothetical protein
MRIPPFLISIPYRVGIPLLFALPDVALYKQSGLVTVLLAAKPSPAPIVVRTRARKKEQKGKKEGDD